MAHGRVITDLDVFEVSFAKNPKTGKRFLLWKDELEDESGSEGNNGDDDSDDTDYKTDDAVFKAAWTTKFVNTLPDSAFLYIESGGKKDTEGKTVPRTNRHFPYKNAQGEVDLPHLRNAIARIPQSNALGLTAQKKTQLQAKARALLAKHKDDLSPQGFAEAFVEMFAKELPDTLVEGLNTYVGGQMEDNAKKSKEELKEELKQELSDPASNKGTITMEDLVYQNKQLQDRLSAAETKAADADAKAQTANRKLMLQEKIIDVKRRMRSVPYTSEKLADLLLWIQEADEGRAKELDSLLVACNNTLAHSALLSEQGADGDSGGPVEPDLFVTDTIEREAKKLMDTDPKMQLGDALRVVLKRDPTLYKRYVAEHKRRARQVQA